MPASTEFVTFTVRVGKESRAAEWLAMLQARQAECVTSLDREHMHFESIFKHEANGRLLLSWFSVQGQAGASVSGSPLEVDRLHLAFWRECIDSDVPPEKHQHVVNFVPLSVQRAINDREATLNASAV